MSKHQPALEKMERDFYQHQYVADQSLTMALHLVLKLEKPLLVEGPAGVGKTEIAKTLARILDTRLIRLQCYEGIDSQASSLRDPHLQSDTRIE
ncbi:AAA family ATPase [Brevibacillus ruminantium]|uniref:AAA family ATPase n=1 Tax=Brevibacillus ruminantium TaxID=2950604 RepID=A0ABY4W8L9_9BACL|nr:AAA family ATPase [Brevibacillus ruminantium]USG63367.1 AAA family ATPase [Brevibacillus ruminantium]